MNCHVQVSNTFSTMIKIFVVIKNNFNVAKFLRITIYLGIVIPSWPCPGITACRQRITLRLYHDSAQATTQETYTLFIARATRSPYCGLSAIPSMYRIPIVTLSSRRRRGPDVLRWRHVSRVAYTRVAKNDMNAKLTAKMWNSKNEASCHPFHSRVN